MEEKKKKQQKLTRALNRFQVLEKKQQKGGKFWQRTAQTRVKGQWYGTQRRSNQSIKVETPISKGNPSIHQPKKPLFYSETCKTKKGSQKGDAKTKKSTTFHADLHKNYTKNPNFFFS